MYYCGWWYHNKSIDILEETGKKYVGNTDKKKNKARG